jgi:cytochrome P450
MGTQNLTDSCCLLCIQFGGGHRSCLGKNISYLEIYKLVPTLIQRYDISLADPEREWDVQNRWFVPQFGFDVMLKIRE